MQLTLHNERLLDHTASIMLQSLLIKSSRNRGRCFQAPSLCSRSCFQKFGPLNESVSVQLNNCAADGYPAYLPACLQPSSRSQTSAFIAALPLPRLPPFPHPLCSPRFSSQQRLFAFRLCLQWFSSASHLFISLTPISLPSIRLLRHARWRYE